MRSELLQSISEIMGNYRLGELPQPLDSNHVDKWVRQFSEESQEVILAETLHILKEWYFTNDHGDQNAQQEPQEPIPGQLLQQVLHFGSGSHLQTVAHVLHSEQEGTQTSQQGNDVGYTHAYSSL